MFWNDIEEIKESIQTMDNRICRIFHSVEKLLGHIGEGTYMPLRCDGERVMEAGIEDLKESIFDVFCSEDDNNSLNRIHDKLDSLLSDAVRAGEVLVAEKTLDKFEEYMKNVDKFNAMINEFKGCVSMARASIAEGNILTKTVEEMKKVADISQNIHRSMLSFIRAGNNMEQAKFFKIDAIYAAICGDKEKKSPKKRKSVKKTAKKAAVSLAL